MTDPYLLSPEESEYLDANYQGKWQKLCEGGGKFGLLIRSFPIPSGYTCKSSDLTIPVHLGYPGVPLDMFYFHPELHKANKTNINAVVSEDHFGRTWQRWSRHYNWTPGRDDVVSRVEYVSNEIRRELTA